MVNITKDGLMFGAWQYLDEEVSAILERLATDHKSFGNSKNAQFRSMRWP